MNNLKFVQINENKKNYLDLLILGDEQEDMIDKYIYESDFFLLYGDELIGGIVIKKIQDGIFEIKNLAVYDRFQKRGYGRKLIEFAFEKYKKEGKKMLVGTGESPLTLPFYEKCGFVYSHRIKNFFTDNYREPVFEAGKQLTDMIYLKKSF